MADNSVNIKVTVDNGVKVAEKSFKDLSTTVKDLDYQWRKQTISTSGLLKNLSEVENQSKKLNLTYKQNVDLTAQVFQVQERAKNGFTSMSKSLHELTQNSNRSQQGFVALAYIIQDLPYGIRGVANNITQLSQVLGTPIWLNLAISGITSLAVVMSNMRDTTKEANEAVKDFFSQFTAEKLDITGLQSFRDRVAGDIKSAEQAIKYRSGRIAPTKETMGTEFEKIVGSANLTKEYVDLMNKKSKDEIAINKEILKDIDSKISKQKQLNDLIEKYGMFIQEKPDKEKNRRKDKLDPLDMSVSTGTENENWNRMFDVNFRRQEQIALRKKKKGSDSDLEEEARMYDNLFFNPMKDGFNDLNSVIRNELFGSLDEMKNKFGVLGASIIQALNSVIAKLLETAIMASIVSIATGGSTSFIGAFTSIASGTASAGSMIMGSNRMANQMVMGGGAQVIQIVGESRIKDDHILIQYKRANSVRKAVRA